MTNSPQTSRAETVKDMLFNAIADAYPPFSGRPNRFLDYACEPPLGHDNPEMFYISGRINADVLAATVEAHYAAQHAAIRQYSERKSAQIVQLVAALSKLFPSVTSQQGQRPERSTVIVELPSGQVTWSFDIRREEHLFSHLAAVEDSPEDGCDTAEKYRRLNALEPAQSAAASAPSTVFVVVDDSDPYRGGDYDLRAAFSSQVAAQAFVDRQPEQAGHDLWIATVSLDAEAKPEPEIAAPATVCKPMFAGEDGWSEWVNPVQGYLMQCCDCGLIHEMETELVRQVAPTNSEGQAEVEEVDDPALLVTFRMRRHAPATVAPEPLVLVDPASWTEEERADLRAALDKVRYEGRFVVVPDHWKLRFADAGEEAPAPAPFKLSPAHRDLLDKMPKLEVHRFGNSKNEHFLKRLAARLGRLRGR